MPNRKKSKKEYQVNKIENYINNKPQAKNEKQEHIDSDVLGSYTGVPAFGEMPEQDSDDL